LLGSPNVTIPVVMDTTKELVGIYFIRISRIAPFPYKTYAYTFVRQREKQTRLGKDDKDRWDKVQ